jgi:hypothetical protein
MPAQRGPILRCTQELIGRLTKRKRDTLIAVKYDAQNSANWGGRRSASLFRRRWQGGNLQLLAVAITIVAL